jgi:hypothetical protein
MRMCFHAGRGKNNLPGAGMRELRAGHPVEWLIRLPTRHLSAESLYRSPPPNFVPIARKGSHDWWDIHGPTKFSGDWWTTRHWPDRHSREFPLHHRQVFG